MNITIVGLGLIGGSIARRLRGFHDCHLRAVDLNQESILLAKADGVIEEGFLTGEGALNDADLIVLCLYPQANIDFIKQYKDGLKPGAVVTDVSGVKEYVISAMKQILPPGIDFIGGHPMAGREVGGYQSSTDTLFDNASYLITPTPENKPENIALVRELAKHIGCKTVITTTPDEHDAVIAYTSQLMHVMAVALCDNPMIERSTFFSAGSLRDCTRVAVINEKMWSELFCENKAHLLERIGEMQHSLARIAQAVEAGDRDALETIMKHATQQKIKWLMD